MKRNSSKRWAAALVLAMCAADCAGIYAAQLRLHSSVEVSASDNAYADASAIKDTWRASGHTTAPDVQRTYASATPYAPAAVARIAPVTPAPRIAPAPQRLAQASVAIPAFKPRTDAFLAPPRLAEAAPAERVELATEVHAAQHRTALHRASARLAQRDAAPPTSQSFAAAFGAVNTGSFVLPEPTFGKQAEAGTATADVAQSATAVTAPEAPRIDMGDSATIGKSAPASTDAADAEQPALVQPTALPGN